jgi:hypothetical protein
VQQVLLTRTHQILIGVGGAGAVIIAGIGFAGSYAAVRELALEKGFGNFSYVFPVGIDAGICVLLALDLLRPTRGAAAAARPGRGRAGRR